MIEKGVVRIGKKVLAFLSAMLLSVNIIAGNVHGVITDKETGEVLIGATVLVVGTANGTATDMNGYYSLQVKNGVYTLQVRYMGYKDIVIENVNVTDKALTMNFEMESDALSLDGVSIVARKILEGDRALKMQRLESSLAIENLGALEMNIKGIGDVQEGVKKMTGISVASAGQVVVRGLGDRYSTTTLNGLSIASPNPDNKLIPLDIFPSSVVQNITVSKVYEAEAFADYSGAHIDISTKDVVDDDFFNIGVNIGGKFNTLGHNAYHMDGNGLFKTPSMNGAAINMNLSDFDEYVKTKDIFDTDFNVKKGSSLPDMSANLGFGKNFRINGHTLSVLSSLSLSNSYQNIKNAFYKTLEATGTTQNDFSYDSYANELKMAALASLGYELRESDHIGYTFLYARTANDKYTKREGVDSEGHNLVGSNNVYHIYSLMNNQLSGIHNFGTDERLKIGWAGSYSGTSSDEPDRRQVMYAKNDDGTLKLFKLNRQETMRYFGELDEKEWLGDINAKYEWKEKNFVKAGFNYKDKDRDYMGTRFYYNLNSINPEIDNIYDTDDYLNFENVNNGNIIIERKKQPKDSYVAGSEIFAGYVLTDFYPKKKLLANVGLRYESCRQWVDYYTDGGQSRRRELNKNDLFPTLNFKYLLSDMNSVRLSASRTVTRPSFVEMAPFLYQESYGSEQIRGNEDLQNGYNYNLDLRYETFKENGDMFSATVYYKYLDEPIERIQRVNGGATEHSFRNASEGCAAGVEVEFSKEIIERLKFGANFSYMYTNVTLPDGGAYTNKERELQGASPILLNADITYSPELLGNKELNIALTYNMQGSRIYAVGVSGLGDIKQKAVHTLNFNAAYILNKKLTFKLQVNDILNRAMVFEQEVPSTGKTIEVERFKTGIGMEVGVSCKF